MWPKFRFAFSRPGFVTFKLPEGDPLPDDLRLGSVFARSHGFSLGKAEGTHAESLAAEVWRLAAALAPTTPQVLHVWQRDAAVPGDRGFEPGVSPLAAAMGEILLAEMPSEFALEPAALNRAAAPGEIVLDCILVEPNQWVIGYHRASGFASQWPGGVCAIEPPANAVSRAYRKLEEGLLWSGLPVAPKQTAVEIGSSPGGACQALLNRGLFVTGIDPAEMDPLVLEHPRFTHVRARADDLKRREFSRIDWLFADANIAPQTILRSIEAIVTNRRVHVRGMLITLKLLDWSMANDIPHYLDEIRAWGFPHVKARQLAYNRQEICVAARRSLKE